MDEGNAAPGPCAHLTGKLMQMKVKLPDPRDRHLAQYALDKISVE